jgi:hypothetical protein
MNKNTVSPILSKAAIKKSKINATRSRTNGFLRAAGIDNFCRFGHKASNGF